MKSILITAASILAAVTVVAPGAHASGDDAIGWIRETLARELDRQDRCDERRAAISGTINRLRNVALPSSGKVLVVNIPSGVATAYQDGVAVIESRAVVGLAGTPTPDLDTQVTFVRPNPTWTVPESIIARKGWRRRLAEDPKFFEKNGFDLIVNGKKVSVAQIGPDTSSVTAFVQRPGPKNALGRLKIGIANDQAIYLHDTNEPGHFEEEVRLASSGCVRLERVGEIAAWILGIGDEELETMVEEGDVANHTPPEPVRVVIGYWTAWPDADGHIRYYPDVYSRDPVDETVCEAGMSDDPERQSSAAVWTEYKTR